jgi:hypothetical protein
MATPVNLLHGSLGIQNIQANRAFSGNRACSPPFACFYLLPEEGGEGQDLGNEPESNTITVGNHFFDVFYNIQKN